MVFGGIGTPKRRVRPSCHKTDFIQYRVGVLLSITFEGAWQKWAIMIPIWHQHLFKGFILANPYNVEEPEILPALIRAVKRRGIVNSKGKQSPPPAKERRFPSTKSYLPSSFPGPFLNQIFIYQLCDKWGKSHKGLNRFKFYCVPLRRHGGLYSREKN